MVLRALTTMVLTVSLWAMLEEKSHSGMLAIIKVRELCLITQTISYMDTGVTEAKTQEDFKNH